MKLKDINPKARKLKVRITRWLNPVKMATGGDNYKVGLEYELSAEDDVDIVAVCPNEDCTKRHGTCQVALNGRLQYDGINCTPFVCETVAHGLAEAKGMARCDGYHYLYPGVPSKSCDALARIEVTADYEAQ